MITMKTLDSLIQRGMREVGYIEKASALSLDSKTANRGDKNYTKYARDINALGLMGCQAQAWCCTFQFWLEVQEFGVDRALKHWNMTRNTYVGYNCFATYNAFKKKNKVGATPKLGAIVIFNFSHAGRVIDIYTKNGVKYFTCLEGNTSSNLLDRNGGQVTVKQRLFNDHTVKGFCYIDYEEPQTNIGWVEENGHWRYYHKQGDVVTYIKNDWHLDDAGQWSYFDGDGYALCNQWLQYKNNWYFFNGSCYMKTSEWVEWKGKWYYLTADGTMATDAYVQSKQPPKIQYYYVNKYGVYDFIYNTTNIDLQKQKIVI